VFSTPPRELKGIVHLYGLHEFFCGKRAEMGRIVWKFHEPFGEAERRRARAEQPLY